MAYTPLVSTKAAASYIFGAATSPPVDTTGCDIIWLVQANINGAPNVLDSEGNSWSSAALGATANIYCQIFYCQNPITSTMHVFTANTPAIGTALAMLGASGSVSSPFDQVSGANNDSTTSQQPGSVTPTEDYEILILGVSESDDGTVDSGFTIAEQVSPWAGNNVGVALAYKIQTTAGAENPTWTLAGGANQVNALLTTYKSAGAPPPGASLFRNANLSGLQGGGPFFGNPLEGRSARSARSRHPRLPRYARRNQIYVPQRYAVATEGRL